jgi:hypothetical protein
VWPQAKAASHIRAGHTVIDEDVQVPLRMVVVA